MADATRRAEAAAARSSQAADAKKIASLTAQKGNLEKKVKEMKSEVASTKKENDLLRELNEQLIQNTKVYKSKAEEAEKKLQAERL